MSDYLQYPPLPSLKTQTWITNSGITETGNFMDDFYLALATYVVNSGAVADLATATQFSVDDLWQLYVINGVASDTTNTESGNPAVAGRGKSGFVGNNPGHYYAEANRVNPSIPLYEVSSGVSFVTPDNLTTETSVNLSTPCASLCGVCFSEDGTVLYTTDQAADTVDEFSLSTGFDLTTVNTTPTDSYDDTANVLMRQIQRNADGSYLYYQDNFDDRVSGFPLSTPLDLTTAGAVDDEYNHTDVASCDGAFCFANAGAKMYVGEGNGTDLREYDLSPAYDVSTAVAATTADVSTAVNSVLRGCAVSSDGTQIMLVGGTNSNVLFLGTMSTPYDLTTLTVDTVNTKATSVTTGQCYGMGTDDSGGIYVSDNSTRILYRYTT